MDNIYTIKTLVEKYSNDKIILILKKLQLPILSNKSDNAWLLAIEISKNKKAHLPEISDIIKLESILSHTEQFVIYINKYIKMYGKAPKEQDNDFIADLIYSGFEPELSLFKNSERSDINILKINNDYLRNKNYRNINTYVFVSGYIYRNYKIPDSKLIMDYDNLSSNIKQILFFESYCLKYQA